jgi:hypothetical protein
MGFVRGAREMENESSVQTVRIYEGKELLERLSCRWENIIENGLQ